MTKGHGKTLAHLAGLTLGLALLGWALVRAGDEVQRLTFSRAHAGEMAGMALLVLANLGLTGTLFWMVTLSFTVLPAVRLRRMIELVCASALINYLPLGWPGPVARSAYLKLRHNMPVRQSLAVVAIVLLLTAALGTAVFGIVLIRSGLGQMLAALVLLTLFILGSGPIGQAVLHRPIVAGWAWTPLKAADLLVGAGRLWLAFAVLGYPLTFIQALALAATDMVVAMLAITPNGLGLSEWAVGAAAQFLVISSGPVGQLAKLIDRGISVLVIIPTGLWSLGRLAGGKARWEG